MVGISDILIRLIVVGIAALFGSIFACFTAVVGGGLFSIIGLESFGRYLGGAVGLIGFVAYVYLRIFGTNDTEQTEKGSRRASTLPAFIAGYFLGKSK